MTRAAILASALLLLIAGTSRAEQPAEKAFLPSAEAPTGPAEDWCATFRLPPDEFQEQWSELRRRFLTADVRGDRVCQGLTLARLASLTQRQDLSRFGVPYWREAERILRAQLPADDPRIARIDSALAHLPSTDDEEAMARLLRVSKVLRSALDREVEPESFACGEEDADTWGMHRDPDYRPGQMRSLLFSAQLALLRRHLSNGDHSEALALVAGLADLVEDGMPAQEDAPPVLDPSFDLSSLLEALVPVASDGLDESSLQRLADLTARLAGSGDVGDSSAKRALADLLVRRGMDEEAESLLIQAIAERSTRLAAKREEYRNSSRSYDLTRNDASRTLLVYALQDIYEKAGRSEDEEWLLLDALEFARSRDDALSEWLTRLGYFYRRQGRTHDEEQVLRRNLELDPDAHNHRKRLALLLLETDRALAAEAEIEALLRRATDDLGPGSEHIVQYLEPAADVAFRLGQEARAEQLLLRADEILQQKNEPRWPWFELTKRAEIHRKIGNFAQADQLLADAAAVRDLEIEEESHLPAYGFGVEMGRALLEMRRGRTEAADAAVEAAIVRCHTAYESGSSRHGDCLDLIHKYVDEAAEPTFR